MTAIGLDEVFGIHDAATVVNQLHESEALTYRWVMSTTTHVSPLSGIPARLTDQAKASLGVAGVSLRLRRPGRSR